MADLPFHSSDYAGKIPSPSTTSFELSTKATTDIWRKPGPPEISTFNAPILYKAIKLSQFKRARVTISANWRTLFDQGGMVFLLPKDDEAVKGKWVKSGIEFYENQAFVGTVAKDNYSDWSLLPSGIKDVGDGVKEVTMELERHPKDDTLWIYAVDGEKRFGAREVTWILSEPDQEIWVGVYAAKPIDTEPKGEELVVKFRDWELELL